MAMFGSLGFAFPAMPQDMLSILETGDLWRVVPDWKDVFEKAYDQITGPVTPHSRLRLAWMAVLAAYDTRIGG